ncbi:MAG: hypothetical protein JWN03_5899 [Nocardia sp.]|nr:hypothetical protein [Nocardia sp.]MCU1645624.1 hypothetical protein [Nocardia sp.]
MRHLLFLILAILLIASTYDYAKSSGHYPLVVAVGVLATLQLAMRSIK